MSTWDQSMGCVRRDVLTVREFPHHVFSVLIIRADRALALGEDDVTAEALADALASATMGNKEKRIFLRADKTVDDGTLMAVMNTLRSAPPPASPPTP